MMAKAKKAKKSKKRNVSKDKKRSVHKKVAAKKAPSKKSKRVSKTPTKKAKRKPKKSSAWKLSPEKYSAQDIWEFKKDGLIIGLSQDHRFSFVVVPQKPNLTKYDPDKGVNIDKFNYSHFEPGDDAGVPNWTFPDGFPLEEQERIKSLWDEKYDDGMSEAGWTCAMDTYYFGPLSVEEVELEYPHNPV
jgi:hypothetical protein